MYCRTAATGTDAVVRPEGNCLCHGGKEWEGAVVIVVVILGFRGENSG